MTISHVPFTARLRVLAATAVLAMASVAGWAQWAVFDGSNFVKNALTAAQTAQQYSQMLDQYRLMLFQYSTMLANVKQVDPSITDSAIGREIVANANGSLDPATLAKSGIQLANVYRNSQLTMDQGTQLFQQAADFGADMNRFSAASGMTPDEIFAYEMKRSKSQQAAGQWRYQQAETLNRQLAGWQTRADQQLLTAQNADGAVQAISSVAAINHTMTDQLSTLITLAANREKAEGAKVTTEGQDRERSTKIEEEARRNMESFMRSGSKNR